MKKFTAILLVALMLISAMPMSAFAAELPDTEVAASSEEVKQPETTAVDETTVQETEEAETFPEQTGAPTEAVTVLSEKAEEPVGAKTESKPLGASSFTYTVSNNKVTITGLTDDTITDLVIPDTIEDLPVMAIKENAFSGRSQITSITVPNSVTTIGYAAFQGTNPTKVTLPFIGYSRTASNNTNSVFGFIFGCIGNDSPSMDGTTTQYSEYIQYSGTRYYHFYIPRTIKEVEITNDVRVPENAFRNCSWIETIKINQGIESIGNSGFSSCTSLTNFEIPNSVKSIGTYAFSNCTSIDSIDIPNSVLNIGTYAFTNCTSLKDVSLSDNISVLSDGIFCKCNSLETYNFPANLTQIGASAFLDCSSLSKADLEIPDGVTSIGNNAFENCSSITSITVPNSVTTIGSAAFKGTNPTKVTLPFIGYSRTASGKTNSVFGYIFGYTWDKNQNLDGTTTQCSEYIEYDGTRYYHFYIPRTIKEVEITNDVRVPANAFCSCSWIEIIKINQGIESIGNSGFSGCTALTNFEIPDSVTNIGTYVFSNCTSLKEVVLSDNISVLSDYVFRNCKNLETYNFPANLTQIGASAFLDCSSLSKTDLEIPDGVTSIGNNAFENCSSITSITVPNSVTTIGSAAFKGTNPTKVTLPFIGYSRTASGKTNSVFGYIFGYTWDKNQNLDGTTTQCSEYIEYDGTRYYHFYIPRTIKEVEITNDVRVPANAFCSCSWIEIIKINQGIESIGNSGFSGCTALTNFEIPDSVTNIGTYVFSNCTSLKEVVLSDNISVLSDYVFRNCKNLETYNFPANLTQIGASAFLDCLSLSKTDLEIPDGVTSIGNNAFENCSSITSITVPNSVTTIGSAAFKGTNPTKVTLPFIGYSKTASGKTNSVFGYIFGYTWDKNQNLDGTTTQCSEYIEYDGTRYYHFYIPRTIKEVEITNDVRVPANAFCSCSWIEKVYINDIEGDASLVGNNAFLNCKAMTVYINRDTAVHTYCERNGIKHCSTKSITLDNDSLVLFRNGSETIGSEVVLLNDKIDNAPETVWTSSNPEVATVDRNTGVISAVAPGTATITADSEGVTATAEVTVYFKLDGISLNKDETQIDIGKSETLTVIYDPDNTTDSKDVTWKSSNNTVATVDENGTVTAVKRGKATITATGANGVTATCEVQVLVPITEVKFESGTASIPRSTRQKVPFTISPSDYTDTYTVTSSDTDVATVDKFGNVVARKVGTAVITVTTSRGLKDECVVTVYSPATAVNLSAPSATIYVNRSVDLTAELSPSDCTDDVTWSSSDDSIAEVDNDGKVTGISKGVATITATADSGISAERVVTVESDINNTSVFLEYNETDYSGEDKTPEVYVYFDDERLVEETDYLLYYYDNLNAGDAGVIITSLYDGTEVTKTFKINPLTVTALDITCKSTMTYTGSELKGVENITYKSLRLAEGVDYDIRYENNVNVGKATATITGKGNFTGPTTRTFTIVQKPISETTITLDNNTFRYDGKRKTPTVTVRDGAKTLELSKDYTVEYTDNINAGEATVTVTGIGNYGSYAEKKFNIEKRSISDATVVLSPDKFLDNGDGKARCPQVTVTDGDRELEQDVDYTVAYDNNIEAGIGTVVITAKGNYSSSTSANFEICLTGDINNDGRVDVLDATAVQKFSVDKVEFSDYQKFVADVNHDGVVDILDASQIQKYAVDKISSF